MSRRRRRQKTRKNTRKKSRKTRRRSRRLGGQFLGRGSYGSVYGLPRLPCEGEILTRAQKNGEVGKIVNNRTEEQTAEELDAVDTLLRFATAQELSHFFILPTKICKIDMAIANSGRAPYDDNWKRAHSVSGSQINTGFNDKIFDGPGSKLPESWNSQIVYPRGGQNGTDMLLGIKTDDDFKHALIQLLNVFRGVNMLQNAGLIHGDIKSQNTVVAMDGILKIIDIGSIQNIMSPIIKTRRLANHFMYFLLPSTAVYTTFFADPDELPTIGAELEMTPAHLIQLFSSGDEFNRKNARNINRLITPFSGLSVKGFGQLALVRAIKIRNQLVKEKLVYTIDDSEIGNLVNNPDIAGDILNNLHHSRNNPFLARINGDNMRNRGKIADLRAKIFKRIDSYSCGVLLLEAIGKYSGTRTHIPGDMQELMSALFEIVFKCCAYNPDPVQFDVIVDDLSTITGEFGDIEMGFGTAFGLTAKQPLSVSSSSSANISTNTHSPQIKNQYAKSASSGSYHPHLFSYSNPSSFSPL